MKRISFFPKGMSSADMVLHAILWLLRVEIFLAIFIALAIGVWEPFFMSILALVLSFLPELIQNRYRVRLPIGYQIVIVIFIYMSIFMGEIFNAYERYFWWDALLHISSGIILAFTAFVILYSMFKADKIHTSPFIISVFTFSFAMMLGVVWEIFEFFMDQVFGLNMQKNGLSDTMWDMIVNALGALGVSWAGYRIIKHDDDRGLIHRALVDFFNHNPDYLKSGKKK